MKAIIIDDEPIARKGIQILSEKIPFLEIVGEFGNPLIAQEYIYAHPDLDLIFLDVEMPGLTGINYLKTKACLNFHDHEASLFPILLGHHAKGN